MDNEPHAGEESRSPNPDSDYATREQETGRRFTDSVVELTSLGRRWISLMAERLALDVRAEVADALAAILVGIVAAFVLAGFIVLMDLLLYRWLSAALASGNWALFLLAMAHLGAGALLLTYAIARIKGDRR